jgi:hypothetical protein
MSGETNNLYLELFPNKKLTSSPLNTNFGLNKVWPNLRIFYHHDLHVWAH